jgi:surfactin synthase thioesterase subunit
LPYAGGSAAIYYRWHAAFPEDIDLCPIELPGRLSRWKEPAFCDVRALVKALNQGVSSLLDIPFAFFGYSMGALLAYEWARELLQQSGEREPEHLIVAARGAPHLRPEFLHTRDAMPDEELIECIVSRYGDRLLPILEDPEMRALVLRTMRADLGMLDAYVHEEGRRLGAPITAIGGERDAIVAPEALRAWARLTSGRFCLEMRAGDHFFIHSDREGLIHAVRSCLAMPDCAASNR